MESACLALSRIAAALAHNPEQVGYHAPAGWSAMTRVPHAHSGLLTHTATALQRQTAHRHQDMHSRGAPVADRHLLQAACRRALRD